MLDTETPEADTFISLQNQKWIECNHKLSEISIRIGTYRSISDYFVYPWQKCRQSTVYAGRIFCSTTNAERYDTKLFVPIKAHFHPKSTTWVTLFETEQNKKYISNVRENARCEWDIVLIHILLKVQVFISLLTEPTEQFVKLCIGKWLADFTCLKSAFENPIALKEVSVVRA